jgi:hypothetical protein
LHSRCNGHALCPAQLQHTLHVLAEERGFDGKHRWLELRDHMNYFLVDQLQPFVVVFLAAQLQHIHLQHGYAAKRYVDNAVTHHQGAGVDAKNYFRCLLQGVGQFGLFCGTFDSH